MLKPSMMACTAPKHPHRIEPRVRGHCGDPSLCCSPDISRRSSMIDWYWLLVIVIIVIIITAAFFVDSDDF
jgi:hypothetical protein